MTWLNRQVNMKVSLGIIAYVDPMLLGGLEQFPWHAWKFKNKRERATIEVGAMSHDGTTARFSGCTR